MSIDEKAFETANHVYWAEWQKHPNSAFQQLEALRHAIKAYESAKHPVRVDVESLCETFHNNYFAHSWAEEADGAGKACMRQAMKATLAVVKDAAKEMGVEVKYE